MSKRKYVKRAIQEEPEQISLTDFNRNLLHLVKTPSPNKKEVQAKPKEDK